MDIKTNIAQQFKQAAFKRFADLPPSVIAANLRDLEKRIRDEKQKAMRTIRPVRLLLTWDALILLKGGDRLIEPPDGSHPIYLDMTCHPVIFPNQDLDPYQIVILG
jgi:hypothetical protein